MFYFTANGKPDYTGKDLEDLQSLFKAAARDCVVRERNSLVAFQANTGVEVLYLFLFFKLILDLLMGDCLIICSI